MDFTLKTYYQLLNTLKNQGYEFITFDEYIASKQEIDERNELKSSVHSSSDYSHPSAPLRVTDVEGKKKLSAVQSSSSINIKDSLCILRHDVDKLPENSLDTAKIEKELGIKGTYYFRILPESFNEKIIRQIADMGHEIGYHYEELETVWRESNGQLSMLNGRLRKKNKGKSRQLTIGSRQTSAIDLAYDIFKKNLDKLRMIAPVSTICMHGSPLSPFDNKEIWNKYNYRELGIIGEPYLDTDWNMFGYLTDTGRRWNGSGVSVRDKVGSKNVQSSINNAQFKSSFDIIKALKENKLPDKLMITIHPQRWTDNYFLWLKELIWQNLKNINKKVIVKRQISG